MKFSTLVDLKGGMSEMKMLLKRWQRSILMCGMILTLSLLSGCGGGIVPDADKVVSVEPNDDFDESQSAVVTQTTPIVISGSLADADCDVYSLGSFVAGDVITIELRSTNTTWNAYMSVALFDKDENVAYLENYFSPSSFFNTVLVHTLRKDGEYFLAMRKTITTSSSSVNYEVEVTIDSSLPPWPVEQRVFVDFGVSGTISIGGMSFTGLEPFSIIDIGYDTDLLAEDILALVEGDYAGFQIEFFSSYETAESSVPSPYTKIFVTGSDGDYYGLADSIDWYNADYDDDAVVFAGVSIRPSIPRSRFIQSVANVISHELGHLLGLIHTDDDYEIMDQATPTMLLELDQDFYRTELADDEFPIGYQDALEMLSFVLGLI